MLQYHEVAAVPRGFCSSFRDWAAEMTDHPREVIEAALAHVVQNKVEAAYARSDLFERRRLMGDWAEYRLAGAGDAPPHDTSLTAGAMVLLRSALLARPPRTSTAPPSSAAWMTSRMGDDGFDSVDLPWPGCSASRRRLSAGARAWCSGSRCALTRRTAALSQERRFRSTSFSYRRLIGILQGRHLWPDGLVASPDARAAVRLPPNANRMTPPDHEFLRQPCSCLLLSG
jgi:hypothetical protein